MIGYQYRVGTMNRPDRTNDIRRITLSRIIFNQNVSRRIDLRAKEASNNNLNN